MAGSFRHPEIWIPALVVLFAIFWFWPNAPAWVPLAVALAFLLLTLLMPGFRL